MMSTILYAGVVGWAIAALVALVVTDVAATHEPHKLATESRAP